MTAKKTVQPKRIYMVTDRTTHQPVALIKASNPAQAARFHHEKCFSVDYADQLDMFKAVKADLAIEEATGDASEPS
jgi:hypothetical protein